MATVNKSSLRAEFDALKARFESLCAAGKMPEWGTPGSGAPGELAKGRGWKSPETKE